MMKRMIVMLTAATQMCKVCDQNLNIETLFLHVVSPTDISFCRMQSSRPK